MKTEIQNAIQNGMGSGERLPDGRNSVETARQLCALRGLALKGYAFYYARMTHGHRSSSHFPLKLKDLVFQRYTGKYAKSFSRRNGVSRTIPVRSSSSSTTNGASLLQ